MDNAKTKHSFVINALSHCDWKGRLDELVGMIAGKTVMLVAEDGNIDPYAVRVHFSGQVLGYVCRDDAPRMRQVVRQSSKPSVLAKVEEVINMPYPKLRSYCEAASYLPATAADEHHRQFDEWVYSGPLLPQTREQNLLEGAVAYLTYVVAGELPWDDEADNYFRTLLAYHRLDFSDEMFHFRHELMKLLESDSRLDAQRQQLWQEFNIMSRHEHSESFLAFIVSLVKTEEFSQMMARHSTVDVSVLATQLSALPYNLSALLQKDSREFSRSIHYIHPHRIVLRRLTSCIAILLFARQNSIVQGTLGQQSNAPIGSPLQIMGDLVMTKQVDKEVSSVMSGGVGFSL